MAAACAAVAAVASACTSGTSSTNSSAAGGASAPPTSVTGPSAAGQGSHRVAADLGRKVDAFFAADTTGHYRNRRAVIVTVDGRLVVSRYSKSTPASTFDIQTMGGAVMGILIGIAIDDGKLRSLDQTLPALLPSYRSMMSPADKTITLGQLLNGSSGLDGDDIFYSEVWGTSRDWVGRILEDGPTQGSPGSGFYFSSASMHLLSVILSQATGRSSLDYAREKLFTPLGISTTPVDEDTFLPVNSAAYERAGFAWPTDPQGHHLGAVALKLTGLDVAKLGELWLDKGRWDGRQVVSAGWITRSESPLQTIGTESDGAPIGYGYNLFTAKITGHDVFAAVGLGGQLIEVVPDLGVVVAVLSQSPFNPVGAVDPGTTPDGGDYDQFVSDVIEPAVR
ncbi:MAG: serine hydrolase domain-containing protein [Candidatus Limnocylindrales bacterium]